MLALAPDAASQKAAAGVSAPAKWLVTGVTGAVVWGECKGSGAKPYRACVDLSEPAYKCSCPSRKFPCKHALGLLLLWSADGAPPVEEPVDWVGEWLDQRRERAARQEAREKAKAEAEPTEKAEKVTDERRARQRAERVEAGLADLERWLRDQIAHGIADARRTGLRDWDELAKRLIDAQAPGVSSAVAGLSRVLRHEDWPARLLAEYGLIHLLAVGYRRSAELPADLAETIRSRVGFSTPKEAVLARPPVRDHWQVVATRDEERDRLVSRRVWLHGRATGRPALVLSFAPVGQVLDASLVLGTTLDADLAFYPGAAPLRALVAERHAPATPIQAPPHGIRVAEVPGLIADVLARDPWTESWPLILTDVVPARSGDAWHLTDHHPKEENAVPLLPSAAPPWNLAAVSGGHPVTVAAEWTPDGLRLLTTWDEYGRVVTL